MKLLVIEQPARPALSLAGLLTTLGYPVIQRTDWRRVTEILRRQEVAVVLLDAGLPGLLEERTPGLVPRVGSNPTRLVLFGDVEESRVAELAVGLGADRGFGCTASDAQVVRAVEGLFQEWQRHHEDRLSGSGGLLCAPGSRRAGGGPAGASSRVMIVDDDPVAREVARDTLQSAGFLVEVGSDWTDVAGRLVAADVRFDVVLLDVNLPSTPGDELVEVIRQTHAVPPVILLWSVLAAGKLGELAGRSGADGYLTKDGNNRRLVGRVRLACDEFARRVSRTARV